MLAVRRTLMVLPLLLVSPFAARAAERELWKFDRGSFVKVDDKHWVERDAQGKVAFNYTERRRTKEFVGLRDRDRKLIIRLKDDACFIHYGLEDPADETKWQQIYQGSWAK